MNIINGAFKIIQPKINDSGADRLSYCYSTYIIIGLSLTVTMRQYVGSPLQCWCPGQFNEPWEAYAENYCFVYNTYWVPPNEDVPGDIGERIASQLIYYQWVPFIMMLEAFFFYMPCMVWGQLSGKSGLNIENIMKIAQTAESGEREVREKSVHNILAHFEGAVKLQKQRADGATFTQHVMRFGLLDGTYIANVYFCVKVLYLSNIVGQFLMMNQFLGQNDHLWGANILSDIVSGTNWEDSGNFPRIAMCDFQVREVGNMQRYSIQCVLSLNMFNEKIFLFLYWWFIAVGFITILDMAALVYNSRSMNRRLAFVQKFISARCFEEEPELEDFSRTLNADMIVLLTLISTHSSEIVTTDIMLKMWNKYRSGHRCRTVDSSLPLNGVNGAGGGGKREEQEWERKPLKE